MRKTHITNLPLISSEYHQKWLMFKKIICPQFCGGSDGKESACKARDLGSVPGGGRSPGEENGYPFHYSCLKNSVDKGAW